MNTNHGLGITIVQPQGPRPSQEPRVTFATPPNTHTVLQSTSNIPIYPHMDSPNDESATAARTKIQLGISASASLNRQPTLFTHHAPHERKVAELKNVLGNESGKLHSKAKLLSSNVPGTRKRSKSAPSSPIIMLEQAKSKARVELDLLLDSGTCVEGGYIKGKILVKIRAPTRKEGLIYVGAGKVRVVGFEAIPFNDERFIFYHCGARLDHVSPYHHVLYNSTPDDDGFFRGYEGDHVLPFAMRLPARETNMPVAKGVYDSRTNGSSIRYIAMVSLKLRDPLLKSNAIAHVYRNIEVWPLFDPITTLAPAPSSLYATTAQSVFLGGQGKLKLTASLHRSTWIAGQRCYVKIFVANETEKRRVQTFTISLIRSETIFKPDKDASDAEGYHTSTTKRIVARSALEMGERISARHATAKGWWTGVESGNSLEFNHHIFIPPFTLTIPRSKLIKVDFILEIGVGTGLLLASDVSVQLPIRIINHISLDPPPFLGDADKLCNLPPPANSSSNETRPRSLSDIVRSPRVPLPAPQGGEQFFQPLFSFVGNDNGTFRGESTMSYAGLGRLIALNRGTPDGESRSAMGVDATSSSGVSVELLAKHRSQGIKDLDPASEESYEGFVETECLGGHHSLSRKSGTDALHLRMAPGLSGFGHWESGGGAVIRESPLIHSRRATVQSAFREFDDGMEEIEGRSSAKISSLQPIQTESDEGIPGFTEERSLLLVSRPPSIGESSTCPSRATSRSVDHSTTSSVPSSQAFVSHSDPLHSNRQSIGVPPKRSARPLPHPHRPRPHPVFMARNSGSGSRPLPLGMRFRASVELSEDKMGRQRSGSKDGGTVVPAARGTDVQSITELKRQRIGPPAVVELTRSEILTSTTMEDIPRTISALLEQNLQTPNPVHSITEPTLPPDLPDAPVFGRAFTSTGEAPRNQASIVVAPEKQPSSIKSRIAMFEQKSDEVVPLPRKVAGRISLLSGAGPARFSGGRL